MINNDDHLMKPYIMMLNLDDATSDSYWYDEHGWPTAQTHLAAIIYDDKSRK